MTTATTIGDPVPHLEDRDSIGRRWRTGVVLLIVADVAFVGSMVFAYFYLRGLNTDGNWFPPDSSIAPIWVGWAIAGGVVVSAAVYRWGQAGILAGNRGRLVAGAGIASVLVVADIVAQVAQIASLPFGVNASSYSSSVYVLAGANLFHLLLTLFLGIGLWNRARMGKYAADNEWQVRLVGIWWTWIALAAIISAFATSFVASPNHIVSVVVGS
ncbi:MAG: Cytochrome c oxidase subunit [Actinomycetota bacterium]|nr:Cytochrome c oxidase subunit [Actinomycetota bacterium]